MIENITNSSPEIWPSILKPIQQDCSDPKKNVLSQDLTTSGFYYWPFGKSEIWDWSKVLDAFDDFMQAILVRYKFVKEGDPYKDVQDGPFEEGDKNVLLSIFGFTRIVLENTLSLTFYASIDRLSCFLMTTDLDILEAVVELLAVPYKRLKGSSAFGKAAAAGLEVELLRVFFDDSVQIEDTKVLDFQKPGWLIGESEMEHLMVPTIERLIRMNSAISNRLENPKFARIKFWALAVYLECCDGPSATDLFKTQPTIISDAAKSISMENNLLKSGPGLLRVFRCCLKYEAKWSELDYALNLESRHGPVANLLKSVLAGAFKPELDEYSPRLWLSALDFLESLCATDAFWDNLSSAGFVDELTEWVLVYFSHHLSRSPYRHVWRVAEKALSLLDTLTHRSQAASTVFFQNNAALVEGSRSGNGLSALMSFVDTLGSVELSTASLHLLSIALKFLHRLLTSTSSLHGNEQRMRPLLDGPVFGMCKRVFSQWKPFNSDVSGPNEELYICYAHCLSILADYVHAEPTALGILQGSGLTDTALSSIPRWMLLESDEKREFDFPEVLKAIPHTVSALVLNEAGYEAFKRLRPMHAFLQGLFTRSSIRLLVMTSPSNPVMQIGLALQEFVRHHPNLRTEILDALNHSLSLINQQQIGAESDDKPFYTVQAFVQLAEAIVRLEGPLVDLCEPLVPGVLNALSTYCLPESHFVTNDLCRQAAVSFLKAFLTKRQLAPAILQFLTLEGEEPVNANVSRAMLLKDIFCQPNAQAFNITTWFTWHTLEALKPLYNGVVTWVCRLSKVQSEPIIFSSQVSKLFCLALMRCLGLFADELGRFFAQDLYDFWKNTLYNTTDNTGNYFYRLSSCMLVLDAVLLKDVYDRPSINQLVMKHFLTSDDGFAQLSSLIETRNFTQAKDDLEAFLWTMIRLVSLPPKLFLPSAANPEKKFWRSAWLTANHLDNFLPAQDTKVLSRKLFLALTHFLSFQINDDENHEDFKHACVEKLTEYAIKAGFDDAAVNFPAQKLQISLRQYEKSLKKAIESKSPVSLLPWKIVLAQFFGSKEVFSDFRFDSLASKFISILELISECADQQIRVTMALVLSNCVVSDPDIFDFHQDEKKTKDSLRALLASAKDIESFEAFLRLALSVQMRRPFGISYKDAEPDKDFGFLTDILLSIQPYSMPSSSTSKDKSHQFAAIYSLYAAAFRITMECCFYNIPPDHQGKHTDLNLGQSLLALDLYGKFDALPLTKANKYSKHPYVPMKDFLQILKVPSRYLGWSEVVGIVAKYFSIVHLLPASKRVKKQVDDVSDTENVMEHLLSDIGVIKIEGEESPLLQLTFDELLQDQIPSVYVMIGRILEDLKAARKILPPASSLHRSFLADEAAVDVQLARLRRYLLPLALICELAQSYPNFHAGLFIGLGQQPALTESNLQGLIETACLPTEFVAIALPPYQSENDSPKSANAGSVPDALGDADAVIQLLTDALVQCLVLGTHLEQRLGVLDLPENSDRHRFKCDAAYLSQVQRQRCRLVVGAVKAGWESVVHDLDRPQKHPAATNEENVDLLDCGMWPVLKKAFAYAHSTCILLDISNGDIGHVLQPELAPAYSALPPSTRGRRGKKRRAGHSASCPSIVIGALLAAQLLESNVLGLLIDTLTFFTSGAFSSPISLPQTTVISEMIVPLLEIAVESLSAWSVRFARSLREALPPPSEAKEPKTENSDLKVATSVQNAPSNDAQQIITAVVSEAEDQEDDELTDSDEDDSMEVDYDESLEEEEQERLMEDDPDMQYGYEEELTGGDTSDEVGDSADDHFFDEDHSHTEQDENGEDHSLRTEDDSGADLMSMDEYEDDDSSDVSTVHDQRLSVVEYTGSSAEDAEELARNSNASRQPLLAPGLEEAVLRVLRRSGLFDGNASEIEIIVEEEGGDDDDDEDYEEVDEVVTLAEESGNVGEDEEEVENDGVGTTPSSSHSQGEDDDQEGHRRFTTTRRTRRNRRRGSVTLSSLLEAPRSILHLSRPSEQTINRARPSVNQPSTSERSLLEPIMQAAPSFNNNAGGRAWASNGLVPFMILPPGGRGNDADSNRLMMDYGGGKQWKTEWPETLPPHPMTCSILSAKPTAFLGTTAPSLCHSPPNEQEQHDSFEDNGPKATKASNEDVMMIGAGGLLPTHRRWRQIVTGLVPNLDQADPRHFFPESMAGSLWRRLHCTTSHEATESNTVGASDASGSPSSSSQSSSEQPSSEEETETSTDPEENRHQEDLANDENNVVWWDDPGPDPSVLAALPWDMQTEALSSYMEERRRAIRAHLLEREQPSNGRGTLKLENKLKKFAHFLLFVLFFRVVRIRINEGFLDVLSPEMRQAYLAASRQDERHGNYLESFTEDDADYDDMEDDVDFEDEMDLEEPLATAQPKKKASIAGNGPTVGPPLLDKRRMAALFVVLFSDCKTRRRSHKHLVRALSQLCAGSKETRDATCQSLLAILQRVPKSISQLTAIVNEQQSKYAQQQIDGNMQIPIAQRTLQLLLGFLRDEGGTFKSFFGQDALVSLFALLQSTSEKDPISSTSSSGRLMDEVIRRGGPGGALVGELLLALLAESLGGPFLNGDDISNPESTFEIPAELAKAFVDAMIEDANNWLTPRARIHAQHILRALAAKNSHCLLQQLLDSLLHDILPSVRDVERQGEHVLRSFKLIYSLVFLPTGEAEKEEKMRPEAQSLTQNSLYNDSSSLERWSGFLQKVSDAIISAAPSMSPGVSAGVEVLFLRWRCILLALKEERAADADSSVLAVKGQMEEFVKKHRQPLNALVRAKPRLLTTGSLHLLASLGASLLDFENKRVLFRHLLHHHFNKPPSAAPENNTPRTLQLNIRRDHLFEDSFTQIQSKTSEQVRLGKLSVKFAGEEGVDVGGVTREWFSELTRAIFNPDYALFVVASKETSSSAAAASSSSTSIGNNAAGQSGLVNQESLVANAVYAPNPASGINPDHLSYFRFVGRIIGKAVWEDKLLDVHFTRTVYRAILHGLDSTTSATSLTSILQDLEAVDSEYCKSLQWILETPSATDILGGPMFTVEEERFGQLHVIDLIPNGSTTPVTEANKQEWVVALAKHRLTTAIKSQLEALTKGFWEIVPREAIHPLFTESQLELLLAGLPDLDVEDWRAHTQYHGGYSAGHPVITYFWQCLRQMASEDRTRLLQFATGTAKVPLEGFAGLQGAHGRQLFQIHRVPLKLTAVDGDRRRLGVPLPTAHTCFNQLDLPEYTSYEELRDALLMAIREGTTGFGFV